MKRNEITKSLVLLALRECTSVSLNKMGQCQSLKFPLKSAFDMRNTLGFSQGHISMLLLGYWCIVFSVLSL